MADASTSTSTTSTPEEAITLAQAALAANQALQHELTLRAEQLQLEILEADRLLEALESGTDPEDAEDEIQIPGARRAFSLFPMSECLNEESPLYDEAKKRVDFLARITPQSFNSKQLEALAQAVRAENMRLQAYRTQDGNPTPVDLDTNIEGIDWTIVAEKVSDISSDNFTTDQCRIKWVGSHSPVFDHSEWQTPEANRLFEILKEPPTHPNARIDWVKVTEELGTNRTVADVANHGQQRQRHIWDQESDALLLQAVELYVARKVSDSVTPTQCQNRYNKSLDPRIKRGAWTAAEDERLRKAVAAIGTSWIRVAEYVPGRTNDQCNERWTAQLNAGSSKNVWSEEEDRRLIELVNAEGRQWKAISEKIGNGKTGPSCRLRFSKLMKRSTPSRSGLVTMSPAPGTESATSSLPPATPREMSVQSEQPSAVVEGSSAQLTAPAVPPGEQEEPTAPTTKSRGKKRARSTGADADEPPPSSKRKKAASKSKADDTSAQDGFDVSSSMAAPKKRPEPKPKPKPKLKGKNVTTHEEFSQQPHPLPIGETSNDTPRRSARFASG